MFYKNIYYCLMKVLNTFNRFGGVMYAFYMNMYINNRPNRLDSLKSNCRKVLS